MQLRGGVFRTSLPGRFRALDEWILPILAGRFAGNIPLLVQDWAAADCLTSLEWHANLRLTFPAARLTASDLNLHLIAMDCPDGGSYVIEPGKGPLQYVHPPFVLRLHPAEPRSVPVNRWLAGRAAARFERLRQRLPVDPISVEFPPEVEQISHPPVVFRKIPLVHPRATELARQDPSFRIESHSVLEPAQAPAHAIRTMNILNLGYFDPGTIERAARGIWQSLLPGGVWILGRSVNYEPPVHHASVLVKTQNGFQAIAQHVKGSEVEDLVLKVEVSKVQM